MKLLTNQSLINSFLINHSLINKFLTKILFFFLMMMSSHLLWADGKTQSLQLMTMDEFKKGKLEDVFLNYKNRLELAPHTKEIMEIDGTITWNSYRDKEYLVLVTGSKGKVYFYDQNMKEVKNLTLGASEITAVTRDNEGNFYFGSGPDGEIFKVSKNLNTAELWLETEEQFVWDMVYHEGYLYLATGGDGKIYRAAVKNESDEPKLEKLFSVDEPNILRLKVKGKGKTSKLYFSTSENGKLYELDLENDNEVSVVFDGVQKDVTDFVFLGESIYLATSGLGKLSDKDEGSDNDENGAVEESLNYIIKIDPRGQMEIIYHFKNKSIARIMNYRVNEEDYILVGVMEDFQIYLMDTTEFPRIKKIHFNNGINLSSMFEFLGKYYLTSANTGTVYEMSTLFEKTGELESKVIDLQRTVKWGKIYHQHFSQNQSVKIMFRTGNSILVGRGWSKWVDESVVNTEKSPIYSRFIQFKIILESVGNVSPELGDLKIFYSYKNLPHRIIDLNFDKGFNANLGIPPDNQMNTLLGMFGGLDSDETSFIKNTTQNQGNLNQNHNLPFANYEIKDIFSIKWNLLNPDNDRLKYRVEYYRMSGEIKPFDEIDWTRLKTDFTENQVYFDKKKFLDGKYQFKVIADDFLMNGHSGYVDEQISRVKVIDNLAPKLLNSKKTKINLPLAIDSVTFKGEKNNLDKTINRGTVPAKKYQFQVKDELSIIKLVSYSFDQKTLYQIAPIDGIFDESLESFEIIIPESEVGEMPIVIYTQDESDNISYHRID